MDKMLISKVHTPGRSKVKMMTTSMKSPRETPSRSRFGAPSKPALGAEAPALSSQVRVVARVRPFLQSEVAACNESSRPPGCRPHTEICGAPAVCCEIIRGTDGNDIFQIFDSNAKSRLVDMCLWSPQECDSMQWNCIDGGTHDPDFVVLNGLQCSKESIGRLQLGEYIMKIRRFCSPSDKPSLSHEP